MSEKHQPFDTQYRSVDNLTEVTAHHDVIKEAALWIKQGQTVAFPTETVYGLGADAFNESAVRKIFTAKARPQDNPLIVHVANDVQLESLIDYVTPKVKAIINSFWPGPLTLVFPYTRERRIARNVTAGLDSIAVRMPLHPVAQSLIVASGTPIAAPSANRSGKPSPTNASHVKDDLDGRIYGLIDGGETGWGLESTVLDVREDIPMILRPGGVTKEELERVVGRVKVDPSIEGGHMAPRSPGVKYRHYAPDSPLVLVDGDVAFLQTLINEKRKEGFRIGVLVNKELSEKLDADVVAVCGSKSRLDEVAANLFSALRTFDRRSVDLIFSPTYTKSGIGAAIMNRLEKASGGRIIKQQFHPEKR